VTAAADSTTALRSLTFVAAGNVSKFIVHTRVRGSELTEYDLIALFPHLGDKRFARVDHSGEPRRNAFR
jgi:hypothetical protein